MYIRGAHRYYTACGQSAFKRAPFLILLQQDCGEQMYAVVRKVALRQLGHWMMGFARIEGKTYSVSGCYGNDGLPRTIEKIPKDAKKVPQELVEAWNKGGGWNSCGSEAPAMAEWAKETFK